MTSSYDTDFRNLLDQIRLNNPKTADKLEQIVPPYGTRAAFYAAFVIICLEARMQERGMSAINTLTSQDLDNFTYFEYTKHHPQAYIYFDDVLNTYKMDCAQRFRQGGMRPAAV